MWFDHEAGTGGGLVDLVARTRGLSRREALDWTADRIGLAGDVGRLRQPANRATRPAVDIPDTSAHATPQRARRAPANTASPTGGNVPRRHGRRPGRADLGKRRTRPPPIIPISGASRSGHTGCAATAPAT